MSQMPGIKIHEKIALHFKITLLSLVRISGKVAETAKAQCI